MQVRVERRQLDSQRRNAEYGDREEFQGLSVFFLLGYTYGQTSFSQISGEIYGSNFIASTDIACSNAANFFGWVV